MSDSFDTDPPDLTAGRAPATADAAAGADAFISPDLAERLKGTGKDWQTKAEAALALWLDEASLALRKEGFAGLSAFMKAKTEEARLKAESGDFERNAQRLFASVAGSIGRDIAAAAISAAVSGWSTSGARRNGAGSRPGTEGEQPKDDEHPAGAPDESGRPNSEPE